MQEKGEFDPSKEKSFVPSPVNRLDRNTTGLVIFGKNTETLRSFTRYIRERQYVSKYYVTLVKGNLKEKLVLRDRIAKDHGTNISQVTDDAKEGKSAETFVTPIASKNGFSVVEVELVTGRTHQIRVHLSTKDIRWWETSNMAIEESMAWQRTSWGSRRSFCMRIS